MILPSSSDSHCTLQLSDWSYHLHQTPTTLQLSNHDPTIFTRLSLYITTVNQWSYHLHQTFSIIHYNCQTMILPSSPDPHCTLQLSNHPTIFIRLFTLQLSDHDPAYAVFNGPSLYITTVRPSSYHLHQTLYITTLRPWSCLCSECCLQWTLTVHYNCQTMILPSSSDSVHYNCLTMIRPMLSSMDPHCTLQLSQDDAVILYSSDPHYLPCGYGFTPHYFPLCICKTGSEIRNK